MDVYCQILASENTWMDMMINQSHDWGDWEIYQLMIASFLKNETLLVVVWAKAVKMTKS